MNIIYYVFIHVYGNIYLGSKRVNFPSEFRCSSHLRLGWTLFEIHEQVGKQGTAAK